MLDKAALEYAGAAKGWEAEGIARSKRSERVAWRIAGVAAVVAALAVVSVAFLAPLKEVEPFIVRVDNNTGATDVVTRVTERHMSPDEAIDKYFVAAYLRAREGYGDAIGYANYRTVDLMSSTDEGKRYFAAVNPDNPKSVFNVYGNQGKIEIKILSIAFLDTGVASVRYERKDTLRQQTTSSRWIATIGYKYEDPPLSEEERQINPLGFQVVDYRTDPESVVPTVAQPSATP